MTTIQDAADASMFAELTTPRPIEEYHEDMGPVLWWHWATKDPRLLRQRHPEEPYIPHWAGEPPYVGTPNDCGREVLVQIEASIHTAMGQQGKESTNSFSRMVGGWPGYHTHFTPIPIPTVPK